MHRIKGHILQITFSTRRKIGGSAEVETCKLLPCLVNNHTIVDILIEAATKLIGVEYNKPIRIDAEDFAYYTPKEPSAQFGIGICPEAGIFAPLHKCKIILKENGLTTAPAIWVHIVLDQMNK